MGRKKRPISSPPDLSEPEMSSGKAIEEELRRIKKKKKRSMPSESDAETDDGGVETSMAEAEEEIDQRSEDGISPSFMEKVKKMGGLNQPIIIEFMTMFMNEMKKDKKKEEQARKKMAKKDELIERLLESVTQLAQEVQLLKKEVARSKAAEKPSTEKVSNLAARLKEAAGPSVATKVVCRDEYPSLPQAGKPSQQLSGWSLAQKKKTKQATKPATNEKAKKANRPKNPALLVEGENREKLMATLKEAKADKAFTEAVKPHVKLIRKAYRSEGIVIELNEETHDVAALQAAIKNACGETANVKAMTPMQEMACSGIDVFTTAGELATAANEQLGLALTEESIYLRSTRGGVNVAFFK
ncbi:neurofilament medium polypeptide-like, partial [Anopheles bellator]|uniref:neurofilament medium polypeptide-like n=1 Tax=Anopheles bellator TaxID=139047 RepID=UPI002648049E